MEYERKQKIKKGVLIGYVSLTTIFTIFMIIMLAIAGVSSKKKQKASAYVQDSYYVSEKYKGKAQPKYASYDDEQYKITLTADELNNYNWQNFYNEIEDNYSFSEFNIYLNGIEFDYYSYVSGDGCVVYNNENNGFYTIIYFVYNAQEFNAGNDGDNAPKNYVWIYQNYFGDFENSLILDFSDSLSLAYPSIKSAIELDIQANIKTINDGIFETLTSSIVAFIGSISSGITAITSVFYDSANSQLTTIGLLSVIVVSISLAYFLFRLIIGLIRMRG